MDRESIQSIDPADARIDESVAHGRAAHVTEGSDADDVDDDNGGDGDGNDDDGDDKNVSYRREQQPDEQPSFEALVPERESRPYRRYSQDEQRQRRREYSSDDSYGANPWDRSPRDPNAGRPFAGGRVRWDDEGPRSDYNYRRPRSPSPGPFPHSPLYEDGFYYPGAPRRPRSPEPYGPYPSQSYYGPAIPGERIAHRARTAGYVQPVSADTDDEEAPLAETVTLKFDGKDGPARKVSQVSSDGMHQAWFRSQVSFGADVDTELVVINAAESFADERGHNSVTLYCQKDPLGQEVAPPSQMYWLHVRHSSASVTQVIKSLIACCPSLSSEYQSIALGIIDKTCAEHGDAMHGAKLATKAASGAVARVDGERSNDPLTVASATFASTPYAVFCPRRGRNGGAMRSLLSAQYGYDVGEARDKAQALSETQKWLGKDILHVARLRSLVIGPQVLITWGEVPLAAIRKDNIVIDESDHRPPVTVRISDFRDKEHYTYVKHDVSFADLIVLITALTTLEDFDIFEDIYDGREVNAELWAILLQDAASQLSDIRLSLSRNSYKRRYNARYEPPPERPVVVHRGLDTPLTRTRSRQYSHEQPTFRGMEPPGRRRMYSPGMIDRRIYEIYSETASVKGQRSRSRSPSRTSFRSLARHRPRERTTSEEEGSSGSSSRRRRMQLVKYQPRKLTRTFSGGSARSDGSAFGGRYQRKRIMPPPPPRPLEMRTRSSMSDRPERPPLSQRSSHNRSRTSTFDRQSRTNPEPGSPTAIVNDHTLRGLRKKSSRIYHLSSSDDDDDDQGHQAAGGGDQASLGRRPSSSQSSLKSYVRTRSRERIWEEAVYDPEGRRLRRTFSDFVEPRYTGSTRENSRRRGGERSASPGHSYPGGFARPEEDEQSVFQGSGAGQHERTPCLATPTPFLMWRVTQGHGGAKDKEGSIGTMARLLRKVDKSLNTNLDYGKVYNRGYECSLEDLCRRHQGLSIEQPLPGADQGAETGDRQEEQEETARPATSTSQATEMPSLSSTYFTGDAMGSGSFSDRDVDMKQDRDEGGLYVNNLEKTQELVKDIFDKSKFIIGLFVPWKDEGEDVNRVLSRFWGALDSVFRYLRYAALVNAAEGDQTWVIRTSCHTSSRDVAGETTGHPTDQCEGCREEKEYSLVDALRHLHASPALSGHPIPQRPHEDPCIVWLRNAKTIRNDSSLDALISDLELFGNDLGEICELVIELQRFVARPEPRVNDTSAATDAVGSAEQSNNVHAGGKDVGVQEKARDPPALPTSLLEAFENIVLLFSVRAHLVHLATRHLSGPDIMKRNLSKEFKVQERYLAIFMDTVRCLRGAKEDLILSITAESSKSVRLGAVGAEYIVAMVLANAQTGAFRLESGSSKVPAVFADGGRETIRGTKRSVLTWAEDSSSRDAGTNRTQRPDTKAPVARTTSVNLMALYAAHARALDFNATVHPQRRAFLAIRALEEEINALQSLARAQRRCLENLSRVLEPLSFRVSDKLRRARFPLEDEVLSLTQDERKRESDELRAMLHRASDLRARVKESIEVLDEGHGKAIRVFTAVTLFFLPLSFVTSYFGMNVSEDDVENLRLGSWVYWAIACPVTLCVLMAAYLYAYRWDVIVSQVTKKTWWSHGVIPAADSRAAHVEVTGEKTPRENGAHFGRHGRMRRSVPSSSSYTDRNRREAAYA